MRFELPMYDMEQTTTADRCFRTEIKFDTDCGVGVGKKLY